MTYDISTMEEVEHLLVGLDDQNRRALKRYLDEKDYEIEFQRRDINRLEDLVQDAENEDIEKDVDIIVHRRDITRLENLLQDAKNEAAKKDVDTQLALAEKDSHIDRLHSLVDVFHSKLLRCRGMLEAAKARITNLQSRTFVGDQPSPQ